MLNSCSVTLLRTAVEILFSSNSDTLELEVLYSTLFPGGAKETPIVTPLMEFVRQKRAVESGTQVRLLYT